MIPAVTLEDGYRIPRIIVGGWQLSSGHQSEPPTGDTVLANLTALADAGLTTFDCADIYTGVETLFGRFRSHYRTRRGEDAPPIHVHTKCVPDRGSLATLTRAQITRTLDRSLRRLAMERLDLVQFAWWDYDHPGWLDVAGWLVDLQRAGKIRHLGATNFDVPRMSAMWEAGVRFVVHQVQYSILDRRPEHGMAAWCRAHGIHLLCYGTLAGGFLTGRYRGRPDPAPPLANRSLTKYRLIIEEFGGWDAFQRVLEALAGIADRHGVSPANIALGWVLDRPAVGAAILGVSHRARVEETLRALSLELDDEDRQRLDAAGAGAPGPRGDCFGLERDPASAHARIMRYNLNRDDPDEA